MVAIRSKNTKPEILASKFLFSRGFRYRINYPRLPGKPDIVLRKYRTEFWQARIERNKERDYEIQWQLASMGGIATYSGRYPFSVTVIPFTISFSRHQENDIPPFGMSICKPVCSRKTDRLVIFCEI